MGDPNFDRTVILLTEHNEEGSLGFVINKPLELLVDDVLSGFPELGSHIYHGGPVQEDSLFFVHNKGNLIPGSQPITQELYWGGELEALKEMIACGLVTRADIRFFLGYSGWGSGQLDEELLQKAWLVLQDSSLDLLGESHDELWKRILLAVGGQYPLWANSPSNPNLN